MTRPSALVALLDAQRPDGKKLSKLRIRFAANNQGRQPPIRLDRLPTCILVVVLHDLTIGSNTDRSDPAPVDRQCIRIQENAVVRTFSCALKLPNSRLDHFILHGSAPWLFADTPPAAAGCYSPIASREVSPGSSPTANCLVGSPIQS